MFHWLVRIENWISDYLKPEDLRIDDNKNVGVAVDKFDTVYDELTGKYSLIVSRGAGKKTFSEEYTTDQTDLVIITGEAGYEIHVVGVYAATVSSTGVVEIDYLGETQKIFRLYATKYNQAGEDDFAYRGAPGESVKLSSTTGENALFVAVNYRKLAVGNYDYNDLTVEDFQANPATGTAAGPEHLNDNDVIFAARFLNVGEYAQVDFDKVFRLNKHQYIGVDAQNQDGTYKIQYFNLITGAWTDWITDIPTRLDSWSGWQSGSTIITTKVRIIATSIDTLLFTNFVGEWEMKYEA